MIVLKESVNNFLEILQISQQESKPFIFPTDTIYGIGASISNISANREIYKIKDREENKPFPILAGSLNQAELVCDLKSLSKNAYKFLLENKDNYTTFIIKASDKLNDIFKKDNKVAIRLPCKDILKKALVKFGYPITATSVNKSGCDFINNISDIVKKFNNVSLFVAGITSRNISSNIYDISGDKIVKVR